MRNGQRIIFFLKMQGANKFKETREAITIDQETDRFEIIFIRIQ